MKRIIMALAAAVASYAKSNEFNATEHRLGAGVQVIPQDFIQTEGLIEMPVGQEYAEEKNTPRDFEGWKEAAERGNAKAQFTLGVAYHKGKDVAQNFKEAVKWFEKAAEQGLAEAQFNVGGSYFNGEGVEQDFKEAAKWFEKAANQGNSEAQSNLGICYSDGKGVAQDFVQAVKWFTKAAKQGDANAQNNLGV